MTIDRSTAVLASALQKPLRVPCKHVLAATALVLAYLLVVFDSHSLRPLRRRSRTSTWPVGDTPVTVAVFIESFAGGSMRYSLDGRASLPGILPGGSHRV